MAKILIQSPTEQELENLEIDNWGRWSCGVSKFEWEYSDEEVCYVFEGEVTVSTPEETVNIKPGDLVTFPKGLKCVWDVKKPIRKVYKFN